MVEDKKKPVSSPPPPPNTESTKRGDQAISKPSAPLNKIVTLGEKETSDIVTIIKKGGQTK